MDPLQKLPETRVSATDSGVYNSMSWNNGVNMTNCTKQLDLFFKRYKSINLKVLIGFWMKAGYLGPVYSAERTYSKGHALLLELVDEQKMLQFSDESKEMVELSKDSCFSRCRHLGFCVTEDLGLVDSVDLDKIGLVELKDGIPMKKTATSKRGSDSINVTKGNNHESKNKEVKYTACSNPRPDSLKPLLVNVKKPSELLLRGCDLVLQADFHFEKFSTLTVLEISGLSRVPFSLQNAISQLSQLQSLNLSSLPFRRLGIDFSPCTELRLLILKGFSYLEPRCFYSISQLYQLQCLHLSDLLIDEFPDKFFDKLLQLRWITLRGCSRLRILPSLRNLVYLKMLDVSHCSALIKSYSAILTNPELQMLDFSYTPMRTFPTPTKSRILTHVIARGAKVSVLACLKQVSSLEVLDLSGAERLKHVKQLAGNNGLIVLDLSRTEIESIHFLPELVHLRNIILRQCTSLTELPPVGNLTKLEVLDISGCKSIKELPEGLSDLKSLKELCCPYKKSPM